MTDEERDEAIADLQTAVVELAAQVATQSHWMSIMAMNVRTMAEQLGMEIEIKRFN
jgi:shikimate kinase